MMANIMEIVHAFFLQAVEPKQANKVHIQVHED